MSSLLPSYPYLIVGAGISGLAAASALLERGVSGGDIAILDKGRQVGGRMATRRFAGTRFDTGAQFFTCTQPAFGALIERAAADGAVTEWYSRPARRGGLEGFPVWRGSDGMTALPKWIADQLRESDVTIALEQRVERLQSTAEAVIVTSNRSEPIQAEHVIVTAPSPQADALLATAGLPTQNGAAAEFVPCIAALLLCEAPIEGLVNRHGWHKPDDARISWIADNATKGIADRAAMALTFHLAPEASSRIAREPEPQREPHTRKVLTDWAATHGLRQVADALSQADDTHFQVKYWRYARSIGAQQEPGYRVVEPRVTLAGDGWSPSRIESAFISGRAAGMVA